MKLRSDFRAAVSMKSRPHHESGEQVEEPIHPGQPRRTQLGQQVFSEEYFSSARVDQHAGYGGTHPNANLFFCYSWFRLQSMAIHCNRRRV